MLLLPVGLSTMVSLKSPGVPVSSATVSVGDWPPAPTPENAPKPVLVKSEPPLIVKLPPRASAGPTAAFSASSETATGELSCCTSPRSSVNVFGVPPRSACTPLPLVSAATAWLFTCTLIGAVTEFSAT